MSNWFIKTKLLFARIADRSSCSRQVNRISSKKEVLQTSLSDAKPAATRARAVEVVEVSVNFLTLFAPLVARTAESHSNPETIGPFIAANVFPTRDSLGNYHMYIS